MKKLKWWQIGLGVIVVNMLLPKDKKLFVFDPLNRGLYSPLLTKDAYATPPAPAS